MWGARIKSERSAATCLTVEKLNPLLGALTKTRGNKRTEASFTEMEI